VILRRSALLAQDLRPAEAALRGYVLAATMQLLWLSAVGFCFDPDC
jgi:hypothetical protein